jgi:predicted amidohydrolase YtcJ
MTKTRSTLMKILLTRTILANPSVEARRAGHSTVHRADDDEPLVLDLGIHTGFGNEWLKFGAVKVFADGSLIGRTARFGDCYRQRLFIEAGVTVPGSSDRPIVAGAPLLHPFIRVRILRLLATMYGGSFEYDLIGLDS